LDRCVASPLDMMHERSVSKRNTANEPVGILRICLQQQAQEADVLRAAKVTPSIESNGRPIYFTGTVAKEVRLGWVTLEISLLEQWEESLRWFTMTARERIESPEFSQMRQREIPNRLRRLNSPAVA